MSKESPNPSSTEDLLLRGDGVPSAVPRVLHPGPPPLPPPPKFDPSAYRLPKEHSNLVSNNSNKASLPTLSHLPAPPPPLPPLKSTQVVTSRSLSNPPPPPPPPPPLETTTMHEIIPHQIQEVIPPLTSAPNSGNNLVSFRSSVSDLEEENNTVPDSPTVSSSLMTTIPPPPPPLPKAKRYMSSSSAPALKLLSPTQSQLPILILATSTVQSLMIQKNQMTLGQLFTAMINSCMTHAPQLLGRFTPLRSIHRTIQIKWEDLQVRFYDGDFTFPKQEEEGGENVSWENALSYACHTWEGDHTSPLLDTFRESTLEKKIWKDYISSSSSSTPDASTSHGADQAFELTAPHHLPWLLRFRSILDSSTASYQQEIIQCPPIVLLVASTNEMRSNSSTYLEAALESLTELSNVHHWPTPFHNGLYDPKSIRREFLLIHDEVDGPIDFLDATALRDMQNRFGPGCCSVLRINSLNESQCKMMEDPLWDAFVPTLQYPKSREEWKEEMTKHRGLYLEDKDLTSIRRYLIQMITLALIPSMERRIANLNLAVTNGKKGVKNALKSLWRKPKDGTTAPVTSGGGGVVGNSSSNPSKKGYPASGEGGGFPTSKTGTPNGIISAHMEEIKYRYDSIESQTRLLADTLFLMRDYEAALDTYRLVKDDYKQDKSLMNCATVYEMMALCLVLLDPGGHRNKREILQFMDSALFFYSSAADEERPRMGTGGSRPTIATLATRCATRLCLVISSHRNICSGNDLEMADMLASTSSTETAVAAGTLLEQSASHYYRAGMYRKFGFHMLMAGHMFRSSGQDHHALRCFTSAMYVYTYGRAQWDTLSNHVSSALAGQLQSMGKMKLCVQLYAKLVSKGGKMSSYVKNLLKSIDRMVSESYLREQDTGLDINAMRIVGNVVEFSNLDLPLIRDASVKLLEMNLSHISPSFDRLDSHLKVDEEAQGSYNDNLGSDSIWQDLMSSVEAEVQVHSSKVETTTMEVLDMIMAEMCRQSKNALFSSKPMKKATAESRTTRIRMEPVTVKLAMTNPLSVALPLSELQLVARLHCRASGRIFSNEPIAEKQDTSDMSGSSTNRLWTFQTSREIFYAPDFQRCYSAEEKVMDDNLAEDNIGDGPYFVTSRMNIELQPLANLDIALELCPLHVGEMDIMGIRWRAFNQFWVYHSFQSLKPSSMLKLKIEQDLPNLIIDFVPIQRLKGKSPIFQGQVREWIMKVSNIGTAPASNLLLKANLPWIRVLSTEKKSNFVGPTGTLMKLPLNDSGNIDPGQTIEIPLEMRPSGGGRQECYMLFRYQLAPGQDEPATVRWFRKILSFPVYPSITMTASLMPFYRTKTDHILSLDITNYRSDIGEDMTIYLNGVYAASRYYEIKELIDSSANTQERDDTLNENSIGPIKIDWQEQVTLHFLICPIHNDEERSTLSRYLLPTEWSDKFSDISVTDFICIENAFEQFTGAFDHYKAELARLEAQKEKESKQPRHVAHIRRDKSSIFDPSLTIKSSTGDNALILQDVSSLDGICPPQDILNIICCWSSLSGDGSFTRGQHHLKSLQVRPQLKSKGCPLNIFAKHDTLTVHNFESQPCFLDFTITVRNRLVQSSVDFELILLKQPNIEFIGCDSFRWSLGGGEEVESHMKAVIFSSGVYNLQSVQVNILQSDGVTKVPYIFPIQWLAEIKGASQ